MNSSQLVYKKIIQFIIQIIHLLIIHLLKMFHFQNSFQFNNHPPHQSSSSYFLSMSDINIQKISNILLPSKQLSSPKKGLLSLTHSLKDLNDQTVKTKLDACLFGLRTINNKFKKGIFTDSSNLSNTDSLNPLQRNTLQPLQSSILPRISYEQQRQVNQSRKIMNQQLATENSYLNSSNSFTYSSIIKQRLNYTCLSMGRQLNNNMNLARQILPKVINQKLVKTSSDENKKSLNIFKNKKISAESFCSSSNTLQPGKKVGFAPKIKKHLYQSALGKALSKQNRYFANNPVPIERRQIQKIGLYQCSNRYRRELICKEMKKLSPKIEKKELEFGKVCKQNELFLTRPKQLEPTDLDEFLKGEFVISEAKSKKCFQPIKTQQQKHLTLREAGSDLIKNQSQNCRNPNQTSAICDPITQDANQQFSNHPQNLTFFQIYKYEIVKNASYIKFRMANIQIWEQIQSLLSHIITFVKQLKISACKFKANNLLQYWGGKKLSTRDIEKILKINKKDIIGRQKTAIQTVMGIFHAKRKIKSIIQAKAKHLSYMKWVSDRIIGIRAIKRQTQYKINKAYQIHQQLFGGDYQWDTQIYLSSFSQNQFVRNTTQYMESFENIFTHMWNESSKHMILVIPTINSEILQIYQQKIKIKRSVTLICPQVHDLFPVNISLAGCLLFSYEALNKIKQLIQGKKAIIIPGKFSSPKYQLLISEFLRTPLMTSLKPRRDLEFQKQLFSCASLSVLPFISIREITSIDDIITNFAKLLLSHKEINDWVFKINGQFGGRGLATFSMKSSKVLKYILSSCKDTIKPLQEYLKRNLKLKLKINFENSLFMLGDYLQRLAQKGGIIQQQKDQIESYQISFFIQNKFTSNLISCFKCFNVNHSNKAFVYQPHPNSKISSILPKLKAILQNNEYLGYVSVNLAISADIVFGMEIKPYLTHLTSVQFFIKAIESKRQLKLNLSGRGHQMINILGSRHENMETEMISSTLRNHLIQKGDKNDLIGKVETNDFIQKGDKNDPIQKREHLTIEKNSNTKQYQYSKLITQQSRIFPHINLNTTQLQTQRPLSNEYTYLFIPNIILTDVPVPKKAEFIQSLIIQQLTRPKFDILSNNLVLYLSNGLSLSLLIIGKEVKKIKKTAIEMVRGLSEKTGALKIYCGKNEARDVFQFGDIIKAVAQIRG